MTDPIRLSFPAEAENLSIVRQVAALVAARCGFTIDRVEDARLLADEAVTQLIQGHATHVDCAFRLADGALVLEATGVDGALPSGSGFAWSVMQALANEVTADDDAGGARIALRIDAEPPLQA